MKDYQLTKVESQYEHDLSWWRCATAEELGMQHISQVQISFMCISAVHSPTLNLSRLLRDVISRNFKGNPASKFSLIHLTCLIGLERSESTLTLQQFILYAVTAFYGTLLPLTRVPVWVTTTVQLFCCTGYTPWFRAKKVWQTLRNNASGRHKSADQNFLPLLQVLKGSVTLHYTMLR